MKFFDEIDIKILKENFDDETIQKIDIDNIEKIIYYLNDNGIYYFKDILLESLDLFLLPSEIFIEKFENLKFRLGSDYVERIANDKSLIEIMYED